MCLYSSASPLLSSPSITVDSFYTAARTRVALLCRATRPAKATRQKLHTEFMMQSQYPGLPKVKQQVLLRQQHCVCTDAVSATRMRSAPHERSSQKGRGSSLPVPSQSNVMNNVYARQSRTFADSAVSHLALQSFDASGCNRLQVTAQSHLLPEDLPPEAPADDVFKRVPVQVHRPDPLCRRGHVSAPQQGPAKIPSGMQQERRLSCMTAPRSRREKSGSGRRSCSSTA